MGIKAKPTLSYNQPCNMHTHNTPTIKTIIADDHRLFAEGIEQILNSTPGFEIVATAGNGKMLLQTLNTLTPDLILLDVQMPLMDGLATAAAIKKRLPFVKIVLLSMADDLPFKTFEQQDHVDGFINKNVSATQLKETLQCIVAGAKIFLHPEPPAQPGEIVLPVETEFLRLYKLTKTEVEIIQLIAIGDSTKMIAAKRKLSYLTVESHRKNILRKLRVKNMAEVAAFAVKHNLVI